MACDGEVRMSSRAHGSRISGVSAESRIVGRRYMRIAGGGSRNGTERRRRTSTDAKETRRISGEANRRGKGSRLTSIRGSRD